MLWGANSPFQDAENWCLVAYGCCCQQLLENVLKQICFCKHTHAYSFIPKYKLSFFFYKAKMPTKVFLCFIYLESNTLGFPSCKSCVFPLKCRAGDYARPMLDFPFLNVWYHQALLTGNCVAVFLFMWLQDNIPHDHFLTLVIHKVACATLGNDVRRTSKTPDG